MLKPWVNPRSEFYWFRRRIPTAYRKFGMAAEIKFSLQTKDWDEAVLRCQEENLKLERGWRTVLVGRPPDDLSHEQLLALAGEFYAETVAAHRSEPGAVDWKQKLDDLFQKKHVLFGVVRTQHRTFFGKEAEAFLKKRGLYLVGDRMDQFIRAFIKAKEDASNGLMQAADNKYAALDKEAPYYPKFEMPKAEQQFDYLWPEFCEAKKLAAATRKKWEPYFRTLFYG